MAAHEQMQFLLRAPLCPVPHACELAAALATQEEAEGV